ncbi:hypothetical protein [Pseudomonas sp. A-R-19]|uniref:hypothetical protein n=1 Tax=Pseudomonas sp. A-R-19 TaxID=2832403 RepID=UPI001CC02F24|nr:hypothetical protein [Pseudomonas sp. A-R-19]
MRPTIVPDVKKPAGGPGSSLKFTSAETSMNQSNLPNEIGTTTTDAQAILAPLVELIDQFRSVQHLGYVGRFEVIVVRSKPEEFSCSDAEFLREAIVFCGGQDLKLCCARGPDGHQFQVVGASHRLTKALRDKRSDGLGTGLPVVWICPVTGSAFPISSLGHLLDVVASYAHRSARKAASL